MNGKIAFEEHYNAPALAKEMPPYYDPETMKDIVRRLLEVGDERLGELDDTGIDFSVLSLNSPGVQADTDPASAVTRAKQVNDGLAELVAANSTRYGGFATLPMQDPVASATELERCVTQLGFHGVMLNGYSNLGDADTGLYYDDERFAPVWEVAVAHDVPMYLHPRDPLPHNQGIYEGRPELLADRPPPPLHGRPAQVPKAADPLLRQQLLLHHQRHLRQPGPQGDHGPGGCRSRAVLHRLPLGVHARGIRLVRQRGH
jgi:predicted TIM-barrel fold metal-dependent hydrolase